MGIFGKGIKTEHPASSAPTPWKKTLTVMLDVLYDIMGSVLYSCGVHVFTAVSYTHLTLPTTSRV